MNLLRLAWDRLRAVNAANPDFIFTALAVGLTIGTVVTIPDEPRDPGYKDADGLATALIVTQTAAVAFLGRWPLGVLTILVGAVFAQAALNYELGDFTFLTSLVTLFVMASRSTLLRAVIGAGLTASVLIGMLLMERGGVDDVRSLLVNLGIFGASWTGGALLKLRLARLAQVESYAAELSLQRDTAAKEAAEDERARIARELHDAVGHTLNLIVVQAGAAQRVRNSNPSAAYNALKSIENTGRQALNDMDRMLGILRDRPDGKASAELGPRPGLARLEPMLQEARSAGLTVALEVTGGPRKLPVSIDLTAYRIIQEAITNVIKHASGAGTVVRIEYAAHALKLEVSNGPSREGTAKATPGGGRGLAGMRERVALFGGSIESAPGPGGGFVVRVSLPLDGAA
jgi:signal transduction histidine kinase